MNERVSNQSSRIERPRSLTMLGWILAAGGLSAAAVTGRSMLLISHDEITELRDSSPVFFSLFLICPLYVITCGALILRGRPFAKCMTMPWFGYCGPGSFSTFPIFGQYLGIPFFAFAAYALFNSASDTFFRGGQPLQTDGNVKTRRSWLALSLAGCAIVATFVLSAPFGSISLKPYPRPPMVATNVYYMDWVAWQSDLYVYRFDAPTTTCSNFATSLIQMQSFQKQNVDLRVENFTRVPISASVPRWFDVSSVKEGTLLTEKGRFPSSYAVIDQKRNRVYYFHCQ
jgi:hypothetical protein